MVKIFKEYIKNGVICILRIILRVFWILPVKKDRIFFMSFSGKQYSCNPKYIFEYMINYYGSKYDYIWCLNNNEYFPQEYKNIHLVEYLSLKYIYAIMTSGYIICNLNLNPFFPVRKKQVVVNTWHGGGAYKRVYVDSGVNKRRILSIKFRRRYESAMINYFISSCERFTLVMSKAWELSENKFLPVGMPRNDILFNIPYQIKEKIVKYYNIDTNNKIVLYAPTFRGEYINPNNINCPLRTKDLLQALHTRFNGDFTILYRSHYVFHNNIAHERYESMICVSDYPDMQELLCAADILITDYSSSMWDFSLTNKPCFLFAPDFKIYKQAVGFYTPPEEWPFPIAETNEELMQNIIQFDIEKYKQAIKQHHAALGSYETGTATEKICHLLFS